MLKEDRIKEKKDTVANMIGSEPTAKNFVLDTSGLSRNLNWYSYSKDSKDALAYLNAYVKKNLPEDFKAFSNISENQIINTYGWIARMKTLGSTFNQEIDERFYNYISELLTIVKTPKIKKEIESPKKNIRDFIQEKQKEFLSEIEAEIDSFITNNFKSTFDLFQYCQNNNIPKQYLNSINTICNKLIQELSQTDEQTEESWNYLLPKQVKNFIKFLEKFIEDSKKYSQIKVATRKPRTTKAKPASAQIAKLKYLQYSKELDIKSINPVHIVGASSVWVFNTINNKIGVYHSNSSKGFTVKGTHLENWDTEKSLQKTAKKPLEVIKKVQEAGKVGLRKILDELKSKEYFMNGSFNSNIIIIRIV